MTRGKQEICLVYHAPDETWGERVRDAILNEIAARKVQDVLDVIRVPRDLEEGAQWSEEIVERMAASVVVLVASRATTGEDWLGLLREGVQKARRRFVVRIDTERIGFLTELRPEFASEPVEWSGTLPAAARAIIEAALAETGVQPEPDERPSRTVPIDRLAGFPMSELAESAIRRARELAGRRPGGSLLTTDSILIAIADLGAKIEGSETTCSFLLKFLRRNGDAYDEARKRYFPKPQEETSPARMSANAHAILQAAAGLAERTQGVRRLGARHLLGALLDPRTDTGAIRWLHDAGADVEALRSEFFRVVVETTEDDKTTWRRALGIGAPRLTSIQPGFHSDDPSGEDFLDIHKEVNGLASLIAAWSVKPPLSIGLFGEWGSGKTFFMRKLRDRVAELSKSARDSGKRQREVAFYKNIVQIEFNAWHYIEGNLWASLVEHIFAHLQLSDDEPATEVDRRRTELLRRIFESEDLKAKKTDRQRELREVREARRLDLRRLLGWLREDAKQEAPEKIVEFLREKGVDQQAFEQARETLTGLQSLPGTLRYLAFQLRREPVRLLWFAAAVGLGALAARWAGEAIATALASAVAVLPLVQQGLRYVAWLRERNEEIDSRLRQKDQQEKVLEREIAEIDEAIQRDREELAQLAPDALLRRFVEDRTRSDDYRKHLGIIAVVRRDFEKLAGLFESQRTAEETGIENYDAKTVNRIVLYIDDLDRCPPRQVVEVLQAIHLLLAFPLFAVVVGVDARWVRKALRENYAWLADSSDHDGASPHDYLEKIFQIPYWIRDARVYGCAGMIDGLTRSSVAHRESAPARTSAAVSDGEPAPRPTAAAAAEAERATVLDEPPTRPARAVVQTAEPPPQVDLTPKGLELEEDEVNMMKVLDKLIGRSPRAVKRFVNCYRLVKAGMDEEELAAFLGRDRRKARYPAAMMALGLMTGAPDAAGRFIEEVLTKRPTNWQGLAAIARSLDSGPNSDWSRLGRALAALDAGRLREVNVEDFRQALPLVMRYSFQLHAPPRTAAPSGSPAQAEVAAAGVAARGPVQPA
jgi:hypothetical protein